MVALARNHRCYLRVTWFSWSADTAVFHAGSRQLPPKQPRLTPTPSIQRPLTARNTGGGEGWPFAIDDFRHGGTRKGQPKNRQTNSLSSTEKLEHASTDAYVCIFYLWQQTHHPPPMALTHGVGSLLYTMYQEENRLTIRRQKAA